MTPEIARLKLHTAQKQLLWDKSADNADKSTVAGTKDCPFAMSFMNDPQGPLCQSGPGTDPRLVLSVRESGPVSALSFEAQIKESENAFGYPDFFVPEGSLEILLPAGSFESFLAVCQHKAWWIRPVFGSSAEEIPEKTQLLITKNGDIYSVFLCVSDGETRTDLNGAKEGILLTVSSFRTDSKSLSGTAILFGSGKDPYRLLEACFCLGQELSCGRFLLLKQKHIPEIFRHYGWCTWDSLGRDVSQEAIFRKLDELKEKKLPAPWVLIDDGWSDTDREQLTLKSLDADPERFPGGLSETVRILKDVYRVPYVGVWQAMKGYWYGIGPGSEAETILSGSLCRYGNGERTTKAEAGAAFSFWNTWHRRLRNQGIDFVKIDGQGSLPFLLRGTPAAKDTAMRQMYEGMEASVAANFRGAVINCMGMAPENVWGRSDTAVSRSSDDYMPKVPGSIEEHLLQNCYGSLYQGSLYTCDWDMFWSEHEEAGYSAVMRMISGGPVYISDACGRTDPAVIRRITREDGTILKCTGQPLPLYDCLTENPFDKGGALKICNRDRETFYIACFTRDLNSEDISVIIKQDSIPGIGDGSFLVRNPETDEIGRISPKEDYCLTMKGRSACLLEVVPEKELSVFGMLERYIPSAGIRDRKDFENRVTVRTDCGGKLGFVTDRKIREVLLNGKEAAPKQSGRLSLLEISAQEAEVEFYF